MLAAGAPDYTRPQGMVARRVLSWNAVQTGNIAW